MRRILSLWLPQLPLDRRIRLGDARTEEAFAIIAEVRNAWRLTHISKAAERAGLSAGLSLSDARAICPELISEPCDVEREHALLRALRRWTDQLSPVVALDPPDGLLLDITGCAHLFGGEEAMAMEAVKRLSDLQIKAHGAVADTKGAAQALARFKAAPIAIADAGEMRTALKDVPIAALNLPPRTVHDLARTGLKQIGELYSIKTGELTRRFGLELSRHLAAALGYEPDPIAPSAMEAIYAARLSLPEPVGLQSDLIGVLEKLAASVCKRLEKASKGARRFRLIVRCVDTGDHDVTIGFTRAVNAPRLVVQQFEHPLDKLTIGFGADWFRLVAEQVELIYPTQGTIGKATIREDDLDRLVSTLGNRLGFDRIRRFQAEESHLPEREFITVEAASVSKPVWIKTAALRPRPLRLFRQPERLHALKPGRPPIEFEWRRQAYRTKSASGPERLLPEWWVEGDHRTRDYWKVHTVSGPRLWLLTYPGENAPDWFVAGQFP